MADTIPGPAGGAEFRFLAFRLQDALYAVPAEEVVEVTEMPAFAKVPLAPAALMGLANLRGVVVPLVNLSAAVGRDAHRSGTRAIVMRGAAPAALAVDAVEGLVAIAGDALSREGGDPRRGAASFAWEGRGTVSVLDVEALLSKAFPARAERKREGRGGAVRLDRREIEDVADSERLLTFEVAGQEYALGLKSVREVLAAPQGSVTLPRADAAEAGVVASRGALLPLVSLRALLGLPASLPTDPAPRIVVAMVRGAPVGLLVDRVRSVLTAAQALTEPVPAILAARSGGEARLKAIYRGEGGRRLVSILSTDDLFRTDIMQRFGSPDRSISAEAPAAANGERHFLIFRLGSEEFGLPVDVVDEVSQAPAQITRLPHAPDFLEGVINLRGEVLPVIDQRRRFDLPRRPDANGGRLVVVRTERHRAGLMVDSVTEVRRCREDAIDTAPGVDGEGGRIVTGVLNLAAERRMVLLLDPLQLLTHAERGLLTAFAAKTKGKA